MSAATSTTTEDARARSPRRREVVPEWQRQQAAATAGEDAEAQPIEMAESGEVEGDGLEKAWQHPPTTQTGRVRFVHPLFPLHERLPEQVRRMDAHEDLVGDPREVWLYAVRFEPSGRKRESVCATYPIEEFSLERLRADGWGGGLYRVQWWAHRPLQNGKTVRELVRMSRLELELPVSGVAAPPRPNVLRPPPRTVVQDEDGNDIEAGPSPLRSRTNMADVELRKAEIELEKAKIAADVATRASESSVVMKVLERQLADSQASAAAEAVRRDEAFKAELARTREHNKTMLELVMANKREPAPPPTPIVELLGVLGQLGKLQNTIKGLAGETEKPSTVETVLNGAGSALDRLAKLAELKLQADKAEADARRREATPPPPPVTVREMPQAAAASAAAPPAPQATEHGEVSQGGPTTPAAGPELVPLEDDAPCPECGATGECPHVDLVD